MKKRDLTKNLANQRQRFSIRKLTIGAASVLLGTTFLFGAGQVQAAENQNGGVEEKTTETTASETSSANSNGEQPEAASNTDQAAQSTTSEADNQNKQTSSADSTTNNSSEDHNDESTSVTSGKKDDQVRADSNVKANQQTTEEKNNIEKNPTTTTFNPQKVDRNTDPASLAESKVQADNQAQDNVTVTIKDRDPNNQPLANGGTFTISAAEGKDTVYNKYNDLINSGYIIATDPFDFTTDNGKKLKQEADINYIAPTGDVTVEVKHSYTIIYGDPKNAQNNPSDWNPSTNDPNGKYPVTEADLKKDITYKRTIIIHDGDDTSTITEWINGYTWPPASDDQSNTFYRDATIDNVTKYVAYNEWNYLNRATGGYVLASSKKIPAYQLRGAATDAEGNTYTKVPEASVLDPKFGAGSTIELTIKNVKVNVVYKDAATEKVISQSVNTNFEPQANGSYEYDGSSANLKDVADTAANYSLLVFDHPSGVTRTFNSLWVGGTKYANLDDAKVALKNALSDYQDHNITVFVNSKYQLALSLYDDDTQTYIKVPTSDPSARYMQDYSGHSLYNFNVVGNQYVVDLTKLYNYTMTDQSLADWNANFEKHSNGYWYTKANMDKPITLTLHYKSNGKYSFVATMRDSDGNVIPAAYTNSLGSMYKNGSYVYAQMKPGAYVNDLTKFKLDDSYDYDYYLSPDSLTQLEKYFEKHSNGYWYAKSDLKTNVDLNLTYDKVQKRNIELTLVDADTGDAITNYAEKVTTNGRAFDSRMEGNVYHDYSSEPGFAEYLLHMPGYELTDNSKAKLKAFLANPYVEEDFTGTLEYKKLAPIHVVAQDSNGNTLFKYDITTQNSQAGNPYEVNALNIPGYKLVKDENNNGEVSTTEPTVTFTYEKDPTSNEGTWIKDYDILKPGRMLPDHVGTIGVPNGKYNTSFDDAQAENIKYYQEHGYTYLGAANAFKGGQQWYPLSWIKATFVPNQAVTVHFYGINADQTETKLGDDQTIASNPNNPDQSNNGINEDQFYYPEGSYTANPGTFAGWTLVGIRDANGNFTKLNYENNNLVLAAGLNQAPVGQINGEFLPYAQDITYIYAKVPVKQTEEKTASRTIHYVANTVDGEELQPSTTQNVTIEGTYYVSPTDGKRVGVKTIKIGGQDIEVVDPDAEATEIWAVKKNSNGQELINDVTKESDNNYKFGKKDQAIIDVDASWSHAHNNVATGEWHHKEELDQNNQDKTINLSNWPDSLDDVYLVYKQPVSPVPDVPPVPDTPPTSPTQPTVPEQPTSPTSNPSDPTQPTQPTSPSNPTQPAKQKTPEPSKDKSTKPNKPNNKQTKQNTPKKQNKQNRHDKGNHASDVDSHRNGADYALLANHNHGNHSSVTSNKKTSVSGNHASELPQTGAESNNLGLIGALVASLGSLFSLFGVNKKRKD